VKKGVVVLSLFDGMSCGRIAFERAGIKVKKYYASEIDKYAQIVSEKNYPDIIRLGDITTWREWNIAKPDIIIGGSPCQGFSVAGKGLNFDDPRSKLFFKFVEILRHYKPRYFLLENVKMKKEWQDIITNIVGVEPVEINSSLVSAQNRKRLYWTNIPVIGPPEDKGIMLKDIVHENCDIAVLKDHGEYREKSDKANCIDANYWKGVDNHGQRTVVIESLSEYIVPFDKTLEILEKEVERGKAGFFRKDSQVNGVYYIHDKAVTLCGDAGGGAAKMGQYLFGCITPDRINKRQNGQRFSDGKKFYTLTAQDKHGVLIEGYIRKLTPVECERLQTVPDNYTVSVSNSQRYKMLGNGWTVDVIAHIFRGLK